MAVIGLGVTALAIISLLVAMAPIRMSINRRATLLGLGALLMPGLLLWAYYSGRAPLSVPNLIFGALFALGFGLFGRWQMKSYLAAGRESFLTMKGRGELKGIAAAFARVYFEVE